MTGNSIYRFKIYYMFISTKVDIKLTVDSEPPESRLELAREKLHVSEEPAAGIDSEHSA